jgi:ariadne-1
MESDDDYDGLYEATDSGNVSPEEEDSDEMEDDMDIGLGEEPGNSEDKTEEEYYFEVLTTDEIVNHMVESIKEVNNVIEIPITTVRILLNHFKWDKEKLMDQYYSDSQERMFKEAHVVSPYRKPVTTSKVKKVVQPHQVLDCEICCLSLPKQMMTGLECGHLYCKQCWTDYLTTKIMDEGASQMIECPGRCSIIVDDQTVMNLTQDRVKLKYQHLITNSFVQCNRLLKWCPSPDCSSAIKVLTVEAKLVKCRCGHMFCFSCAENWHDPVRCTFIKKWCKKCDDDSETSNWISANTKECPTCNATIEKDGGCNHVICKNTSCKAEFCWVCLGPWEPHGSSWYNCNRFNEKEAQVNRDSQEKSRALLQRYLFYCNRYMNHLQSLKFESKLYAMVKDKMEEMQQHNMSWIEVQFLKKSLDILCECRRTLMYTYVFAYYLRKNHQQEIFEDNQRDLENATEQLSEYLERDISAENLADIKQKVQDKYRYCDSRRKVLLNHVYEGYEKEWWDYTEPPTN